MVRLTVNGEARDLDVPEDASLLSVLRNELALNGAKFGCGLGQCGACTVVVDGAATVSCMTPVGAVAGRTIVTVEGLTENGKPGRLQRAFLEEQAAQCGYCTPGMIMGAHALLQQNPQPSDGEIRAALDGNLCRCGSHNRIVRAVQRAAQVG